jgi:hypothetical protein
VTIHISFADLFATLAWVVGGGAFVCGAPQGRAAQVRIRAPFGQRGSVSEFGHYVRL